MIRRNEPHESLCGARTRRGHSCRRWPMKGRTRCLNHGGASTGPKTRAGKAKASKNALKHGFFSIEIQQQLRASKELMRQAREILAAIRSTD